MLVHNISNSSSLFLLCIVKSKKLMELWCSFSTLNSMLLIYVLNSIIVLSMSVCFLL
jgi:hypothetical protein